MAEMEFKQSKVTWLDLYYYWYTAWDHMSIFYKRGCQYVPIVISFDLNTEQEMG